MSGDEVDFEVIPLLTVYKKNGIVNIDNHPDTSDYEIYGILKTYVDFLEEDIIESWRPK